jgi:hypothetical protein
MAAHKRTKKKNKKLKKHRISISKLSIYILAILSVGFLIYRIIILLNFRIDRSQVPAGELSTDSAIVNNLFVFENSTKIVNMEIVTYSKDQQKALRVRIPTEVYVSEEGVDNYPISSMASVGEFLQYDSGKEYTVKYMSNLLGLKFDNYVWLDDSRGDTDSFLSNLSIWSILFNFKYNAKLKGNLYSNLPILNLIKEVNFLNQTFTNYQYESMDILECCVESVIVSEKRKHLEFRINDFDAEFGKYVGGLVSKEVEKERVNVEVYNASNISGLASKYARKIRHTGCRILRFDNSPQIYNKTAIYVPEPEEYSNSLQLVRDIVGKDVEIKYERPVFITTGDIVLVLGTDLVK